MTEVGIHNFLTLFLILATTIGTEDMVRISINKFQQITDRLFKCMCSNMKMQRLHTVMLKLKLEKLLLPRQCCLIKGHIALLILHIQRELNTQNCINRLLEQVNKLNTDESKLPVLRIMVDAFEIILDKADVYANGEYLLFGMYVSISELHVGISAKFSFFIYKKIKTRGSLIT